MTPLAGIQSEVNFASDLPVSHHPAHCGFHTKVALIKLGVAGGCRAQFPKALQFFLFPFSAAAANLPRGKT